MRFDLKSFDFVECERAPDALAVAADRNLSWAQLRAEALAWPTPRARRGAGCAGGHLWPQAGFVLRGDGRRAAGRRAFVPVDTIYPPERLRRIVRDRAAGGGLRCAADRFEPGHGAAGRTRPGLSCSPRQHRRSEGRADRARERGPAGDWMLGSFGLGDAPVFMNQAPFSFDLSMRSLRHAGIRRRLRAELARTDRHARRVDRQAGRTRHHGVGIDAVLRASATGQPGFSPATLPTLRTFLFCGEPLPAALAKKLRQRFPDAAILNTYGPTEATVATTWIEITDGAGAARSAAGRPRQAGLRAAGDGRRDLHRRRPCHARLSEPCGPERAEAFVTLTAAGAFAPVTWARWRRAACCSAVAAWTIRSSSTVIASNWRKSTRRCTGCPARRAAPAPCCVVRMARRCA